MRKLIIAATLGATVAAAGGVWLGSQVSFTCIFYDQALNGTCESLYYWTYLGQGSRLLYIAPVHIAAIIWAIPSLGFACAHLALKNDDGDTINWRDWRDVTAAMIAAVLVGIFWAPGFLIARLYKEHRGR